MWCISEEKEINCYQKEYYYIKFFVKGHENDLPCFEIRSRDFKFDGNIGKCSVLVRAVLYNLSKPAKAEDIDEWKKLLGQQGFKLNNKKDISKQKQIGIYDFEILGNNEKNLTEAFDRICELLSNLHITYWLFLQDIV